VSGLHFGTLNTIHRNQKKRKHDMKVTDSVTNNLPELSVTTTLYTGSHIFRGTLPSSVKLLLILYRILYSSVKCKLGCVVNAFFFKLNLQRFHLRVSGVTKLETTREAD
jgi:hypothetical protein